MQVPNAKDNNGCQKLTKYLKFNASYFIICFLLIEFTCNALNLSGLLQLLWNVIG